MVLKGRGGGWVNPLKRKFREERLFFRWYMKLQKLLKNDICWCKNFTKILLRSTIKQQWSSGWILQISLRSISKTSNTMGYTTFVYLLYPWNSRQIKAPPVDIVETCVTSFGYSKTKNQDPRRFHIFFSWSPLETPHATSLIPHGIPYPQHPLPSCLFFFLK